MESFAYLFPFLVIGMFILVMYIMSKMGWDDLVANYEASVPFTGQRVGIISASINSLGYRNSLVLKYNDQVMLLKPVFILRLFHKPIFIPWSEIKEIRDKKILFTNLKQFIIGNPFVAVIGMEKSTFSKIENYLHYKISK